MSAEEWSATERDFVDALYLGVRYAPLGGVVDPRYGALWGDERTVRSAVLREVLLDRSDRGPVRAVLVAGVAFDGPLDLTALTIAAPVRFERCWFSDSIELEHASVLTLSLYGCVADGVSGVQMRAAGSFRVEDSDIGPLDLSGAIISGQVSLNGSSIDGRGDDAVTGDGLLVEQDLFARNGFRAHGQVRLPGSHIRGQFVMERAELLRGPSNEPALNLTGARIDQLCALADGFSCIGEVRLMRARFGAGIALIDAQIRNPDGLALDAEGVAVEADLLIRGLRMVGGLDLGYAEVAGSLLLMRIDVAKADGVAIYADGCRAGGDLLLTEFTVVGSVSLANAEVRRQISLIDGQISATRNETSVDLSHVVAGVDLWLLVKVDGWIDLYAAHTAHYYDSRDTWAERMRLEHFVYKSIEAQPRISVRDRLAWLERNMDGYSPQPYEQLMAVVRQMGREGAARRVGIEKQRRRRARGPWAARLWSRFLDITVAYGYRTWQVLWVLLALVFSGWLLFRYVFIDDFRASKEKVELVAVFRPGIYTLDTVLPLVNLHQRDAWNPDGFVQYVSAVYTLLGWLLTTVVIAALTGLLKRE